MSQPAIEGRLHPVTPLRHSWAVLAALATLAYQLRDLFSFGPRPEGSADTITLPLWAACTAAVLIVSGTVGLFTSAWRHSHYSLDGSVLEYRSGLLFKVHRHCELDHVQSVDILRPFLGKIIGVCTLSVVVPGTTMTLSYLTLNQARALKARILAEDTAEDLLHRVKTKDLALALLLDIGTNLWSLAMVAVAVLPYVLSGELLTLSTLFAFAPRVWRLTGKKLFVYSGWSVTRTADGTYRTDYGMFDTKQYTYRDSRITFIQLYQPLLWRRFDWVEVRVAVAGAAAPSMLIPSGAAAPSILIPVCPRPVAEKMVLHLLGQDAVSHLNDPLPAPPAARKATPFHKALGYRLGSGYFTAWSGYFLRNVTTVCPVHRVQSVSTRQGPWQRRLGLASVYAYLPGGGSVPAAHRTTSEAADLATRLYRTSMEEAEAQHRKITNTQW
ncbi:PH domain-containing protein (plasmid) [Streptomyces sp. NBC_00015]|uniref:PH domain-containing protein n=1 Tax=Streptomyces sp. NBC_00015 TaxID=2903611 RepID=UPI002F90DE93